MTDAEGPIVFCHGLFGWGGSELAGYPYFVCAHAVKRKLGDAYPPFLYPATGPISSAHDQACELFYQLKGGRVNYGLAHSEAYAHERYGRDYSASPLYPAWDADHPIDIVAHSMGAVVARRLQRLLADGFFDLEDGASRDTSPEWIRSITTVSGVHNGSTLTWALGADEETGIPRQDARALRLITSVIGTYAAIQEKSPRLTEWYDLQLDQWGLESSPDLARSLTTLFSDPRFYASKDWALYDLTPNALEAFNAEHVEYPCTRYLSVSTRSTIPFPFPRELPLPYFTHFFLIPFALMMASFKATSERWKRIVGRSWRANDGMCPTWSHDGPKLGRVGERAVILTGSLSLRSAKRHPPPKGRWTRLKRLTRHDHAEVAMLPHFLRIPAGSAFYRRLIDYILYVRKLT